MTSPKTERSSHVLSPVEADVLLACARVRMGTADAKRLRALSATRVDWEHLRRNALKHGVVPLVYQRLSTHCADVVPAAALDQLRADNQHNSIRTLAVTAELLRLLGNLEREGIPAVPYKGPVLAAHVYGNLSTRQFGDLDILVRARDVPRAKQLLCDGGYVTKGWPSEPDERLFLLRKHVQSFHSVESGVHLELHWDFTPRELDFPLDLEQLWGRLERRPLGSSEVLALQAEDLLLILCVHGAKHCWSRLKGIRDVAELIESNPRLDWARITDHASELGARRMLWLGLYLACELLGAAVPADIRRHIDEDAVVPNLAGDVRARLFRDDVRHAVSADAQLFYLKMRERMRERLPQAMRYVRSYTREWLNGGADDAA
jgi:hypothetical protein